MKKLLSLILIVMMLLTLTACGGGTADDGKLSIVCTTFPHYDWVRNILGSHLSEFNLTLLLNSGTDLHNYQPTAPDLITIGACDLFIYIGGESDSWAEKALANPSNENRQELALLHSAELIAHQHEDNHDEHEHEEGHEHAFDEHIWLSLSNAASLVEVITSKIAEIDPENADDYNKNAERYIADIDALDEQYRECVDNADYDTLVFAGQFPFAYMACDYDLDYYAATNSCSAEMGPGVSRLLELAKVVDEKNLPAVLLIETTNRSDAEAIISATEDQDQLILTLDSMQSVNQSRIDADITYMKIMESNLAVLQQALYKGE
ncbi:MAG: zinc ABC transporter substrate-binding protein [Clostridia bacterium]|nr:zinc ABC transporter substrate-binding protein [Clostridia bacterium]MBQ7090404.1 zinc ABC transporter substrate-binding protein [Clostridia bacterium]